MGMNCRLNGYLNFTRKGSFSQRESVGFLRASEKEAVGVQVRFISDAVAGDMRMLSCSVGNKYTI